MSEERWSLLFLPGTYGTAAEPLQIKVGYYTEVAGLGADPVRRGDQRQGRGLQPLPHRRPHAALLRRAQQLLALAVQPDDRRQRRRPGRLPGVGELLGDLAGRLAAPRRHPRRQPLADGLLHRGSAVRQRRLPRRLPRRRGHQRLAAAVADPQQRGRELVQRRVEPGLRRHHRRALGGRLPDPALHDPGPHSAEPREALPPPRRRRRLAGPRAGRAHRLARHQLGRRHHRRSRPPALRLPRRQPGQSARRSPGRWTAARTCCSPPACTTSTAAWSSAATTPSCWAWATPPSRPSAAPRPSSYAPRRPAWSSRASPSTPAPGSRRT